MHKTVPHSTTTMVLDDETTFKPTSTGPLPAVLNHALHGSHPTPLLSKFIEANRDINTYRYVPSLSLNLRCLTFRYRINAVKVDGHTLTTAAVAAAARHAASVRLDDSKRTKDRVLRSRQVVEDKVNSGASIYGLSTGFGGSGKCLLSPLMVQPFI